MLRNFSSQAVEDGLVARQCISCKVLLVCGVKHLRNLHRHKRLQERKVIFVKKLIAILRVFKHELVSQVVELILAVEDEQVLEGLWREQGVVHQEVELLHGFRQIRVDAQDSLVMKGYRVVAAGAFTLGNAVNRTLAIGVLLYQVQNAGF